MNGTVDPSGRALLLLPLRAAQHAEATDLIVWIDTAFDGELVIPRTQIHALGLVQSAGVEAILADGTTVTLETYECWLDWFGECRRVEVIGSEGQLPLLGIGLLLGHRLTLDYRAQMVELD
jgi:predicted aspartyl protease